MRRRKTCLFGERGARAVISVSASSLDGLSKFREGNAASPREVIGHVTSDGIFSIQYHGSAIIEESVETLRDVWATFAGARAETMNPKLAYADDHFHDECGVFGVFGHPEAANLTYLGLYALQHRGQESAGIVSSDGRELHLHRAMGEVEEIFQPGVLAQTARQRSPSATRAIPRPATRRCSTRSPS